MRLNLSVQALIYARVLATLLLISLMICFPAASSHAQQNRQLTQNGSTSTSNKRIALVIGNGAYTSAPALKNPPNDARDMAASLRTLGFDVTSGINVNQKDMKRLIRDFGLKLKGGGSGLFYYAGHGVQSKGRNYLIPIDAEIQSEAEVEDSGVDASLVLNYMEDAQNGLNIVILDACRNNPFARSFRSASDGLAQVDAPTGTLIAYATAPGRVASDGSGQNGLYTSELLKQMQVPGVSITDMFMRVRGEVMKQTGSKQVPWEASSLVGSFYFSGGAGTPATDDATSKEPRFDAAAFEYNYWDSIKNSANADDYRAYLAKYPKGQFAELARNKIKGFEVAAKPADAAPTSSGSDSATEVAFWDYIKNSDKAEDFQAYLKKYPNGAFAELANNRVKTLEAAKKERDKEDEAKRLEAEAAKPVRTYEVGLGQKSFLYGEGYDPAKLLFLRTGFRIERDPDGLRNESKVYASIYKQDFETTFENQKKFYASWNCQAFKAAKIDKLIIREIRPNKGDPWRLQFKSNAEAVEALAEIQRICNSNP
jgi:uncharacterized caspase-like protein